MTQNNFKESSQAIDWSLCIELANDNAKIAKELLAMLIDDLPNARKEIMDAYHKKDFHELLAKVHRLHGATCYCGVPNLTTILSDVESQLRIDRTEQIDVGMHQFQEEVAKILVAYRTLFLADS